MAVLMKLWRNIIIPAIAGMAGLSLTAAAALPQANVNTGGGWREMGCRTLDTLEGYTVKQENMELSRYGGWKAHQVQATGFFRVEKIAGRWWAIDPEGYLYIHKALNAVNLSDFTADQIYQLLPAYGFNGIGCWSDEAVLQSSFKDQTPLAYCPKISFMAEYRAHRSPRLEMPVFDAAFETFCNSRAAGLQPYANDPQVFGYFSDNELAWRDEGLAAHLAITNPDDENYTTAVSFLADRGKTPQNWNTEDRDAYMALMAERYYSVVRNAIRQYDTHHLYLGSRCHSTEKTIEAFVRNAGKYVDVFSINHYNRWGARQVEMQNMAEWAGRPLLITEFYAMQDLDGSSVGAGWRVQDQPSRGLFYQHYMTTLAQSNDIVGWHWFKFQDDINGNKGIVDEDGNLHTALLADMKPLNEQLYNLIDYTDRLPAADRTLLPEADAYFKGDENHGTDTDLWVKKASFEYERKAYLRFNLIDVARQVKSAQVRLYSVADGIEAGSYRAEWVEDDSWQETAINGSNCPAGSAVLAAWSDGDDVVIDVTSAVLDALRGDRKLSIRLVATEDNGNIPQYGSREHSNFAARPKLLITYETEADTALFYDDFTDGYRSGWWKLNDDASYTLTIADDSDGIGAGNALFFTNTGTAIRRMVTNFDTVTLSEGDSITLSFDLRLNGVPETSYGLRFGLYDSEGSVVDADYSGGNSGPAAYDNGYYVRLDTGAGTDVEIYKETDQDLLGGSDVMPDYRQYSGTYAGLADEAKHHIDFVVKRTAGGMAFKLYRDDVLQVDASKDTAYPFTIFNQIAFAGYSAGIDFVIDNVKVTVNDWKDEADARIEQIRKGDFQVTVVSPYGTQPPLSGAVVEVEQIKHHFAFGSAMNGNYTNSNYASFFKTHFNWATPEYQAKWPITEPSRDNENYNSIDGLVNFCQANDIAVRGHCLFWGNPSKIQDWVKALPLNELQAEMDERAVSAVNRYKGKFVHWDVNNEMCDNTYYKDLLGDGIRTWMFQRTHELDPACRLFVNEYGVLSSNGYNLNDYKTQIYGLLAAGTPLHGVGVQCHMGSGFVRSEVEQRLDSLAECGLPIWVTELDMSSGTDEAVWADYLEEFFRTAFSHPSVEGIILWGFWEGDSANSPIVNTDWTLNAAGQRFVALMDEWTTHDVAMTDENGVADFRGFYGTYRVTVTLGAAEPVEAIIEVIPGGATEFTLELTGMLPPALVNGDFESGVRKGAFANGFPDGWSGWGANGSHHADSGYKRDNYGIAITANDTACTQTIAASAGEQFIVSAEMIYNPLYALYNKNGVVRVEFWDGPVSTGAKLAETDVAVLTPNHAGNTWVPFFDTATAPADSAAARIVCLTVSTGSFSSGKAYFDNIAMEKVRANLNGDAAVDLWDFAELTAAWNQNSSTCDLTGDGYVGVEDLLVFASEWLLTF